MSPTHQEHSVQLFDDADSLAASVAPFLRAGYEQGETLLVVATPEHWTFIEAALSVEGVPVAEALASGRLIVRDAAATLKSFMPYGWHDATLFNDSVGSLVRELAARGKPLRVYGEMVDVLASQGQLQRAHQLEQAWNDLARESSFSLFCGYSAVNFGNPRAAGALQQICAAHSHVRSNPHDVLASFLLNSALT